MQVIIKGSAFNYDSDFDPVDIQSNVNRNWKVSAGDYFKFPVNIGSTACFIKRFDKKNTEVSGYNFLMQVKGERKRGLPMVYDLVRVKEGNREVIYLFTEYLPGQTLDSMQRTGYNFLPMKLAEDLFFALVSIHEKGYWFPDFDPKNLYRDNKGNFYIIDLDSTYPLTALPQAKMFGSKDYWSPVYNFYRSKMGFTNAEVKQMKGDAFNTLHLLYFMCLYAFYLFGPGEDLTAPTLEELNDHMSAKYPLFTSTLRFCFFKTPGTNVIRQRPLTFEVFSSFVTTCLFPTGQAVTISSQTKKIAAALKPKVYFSLKESNRYFHPGESYTLLWNTANVSAVSLDGEIKTPSGSKVYKVVTAATHVLKTTYQENGTVRSTDSVVAIMVEPKPTITFGTSLTRAKDGEVVRLNWLVTDGDNVTLYVNGTVHTSNLPKNGIMDLTVQYNTGITGTQKVFAVLEVRTASGSRSYRSQQLEIEVRRKRQEYPVLWIMVVLFAIFITIIAVKGCNNSREAEEQRQGALDSTSAVLADSTRTIDSASVKIDSTSVKIDSTKVVAVDSATKAPDTTSVASSFATYEFSDEFTDNSNNWNLPSNSNIDCSIDNGVLRIKILASDCNGINKYFPVQPGYFNINTRIGFSSGDTSSSQYGVAFCSALGHASFYFFYIEPDGYYGLAFYNNGAWDNIIAKKYSSAIHQGVSYNTLQIVSESYIFAFYINSEIVNMYSLRDANGNYYGPYVQRGNEGTTDIFVDRFAISGRHD